jgi:hypothetical protein
VHEINEDNTETIKFGAGADYSRDSYRNLNK